ncbi:MAG: TRAM domain-containing protein [Actinomycetota bacterium]
MNDDPEVMCDVRVERPATGGGVGRVPAGQVVFVRNSLPGELVRAKIFEQTSSFLRASAVEILEASEQRVTPPCPYARPELCGGCDLQHASALAQESWKSTIVAEHLRRIAKIEVAVTIEATTRAQGSRTRLRCAVTEDGRLGLRQYRSHEIVPLSSCWIAHESFAVAFETNWAGADEVELRAIGDGEAFAVVRHDTDDGALFEVTTLRGEPLDSSTHSTVSVGAGRYRVGPLSFWQSHESAPETLVAAVLAGAKVQPGDRVVDLYSGVGLFAVALADAVGRTGKVTAIENSEFSVRDAIKNAGDRRHLIVRDWAVTPRAINDAVQKDDVVVLDPPRSGAGKAVMNALTRRAPRRIVYVSCDAATFARDIGIAVTSGYRLTSLRAFDLFPMTEHVELVGVLDITP